MQDTSVKKSLKDKFESGTPIDLSSTKSSSIKDKFESGRPLITDDMYEESEVPASDIMEDESLLLTDDLKKKRISEIDQEIKSLSEEQTKIAEKINKATLGNAMLPFGAFHEDRKAIKDKTAAIKALRVEQNELKNKLTPPTDQEKEEALRSMGLGSYNNDSESAFKQFDFIQKLGPKKAFAAYNEGVKDKIDEGKKIKLQNQTTENLLSYANMVHGKIPELKHSSSADLDKIWNKVTASNDYRLARFDEKVKMIDKAVSEYVASLDIKTPEGKEPPDKNDIKNRIIHNLLPRFMYSEEGGLSPEGVKLFLNDQLSEVTELAGYYEKAITDAGFNLTEGNQSFLTGLQSGNDIRFNELAAKHGRENVRAWYDHVREEYRSLKETAKTLERYLDYPEAKGGINDIGKVIKTTDLKSFYTLMMNDMFKGLEINKTVSKLENDKPITYAEKKQLEAFATMNYLQSLGTEGRIFRVARGAVNMLPYVAQFAISRGGFTAVKGAATKALSGYGTKTLFKLAGKEITGQKLAATALGAAGQTAVLPQQYVTNIAKYARDNVSLATDPDLNELVADIEVGSGMDIGKAVTRGLWDAYSEIYTERLGDYMRLPKIFKKKVSSLTNKQLLKNTAVSAFMKSKGVTSVKEFAKTISKASGWHGIMEEYLEEVANYYMAGLADPANIKGPGNKEWRQEQLDTFLTVAAFSPIMKSADFAFKSTIGKNVHIRGTYADGKKFDVKLPSNMYREIGNIFASTSGLPGKEEFSQLNTILSKYGPNLNKEQLNLSLHLIQKLGQDKQAEIIAKSNASSLLDMTVEKPVDTDIEEAEKNIGRLTEEERKKVREENERITALYPDLVENNLIAVDPASGQMLEPDKETVQTLLGNVTSQLEAKAEYDDKGNIINPSKEIETLIEKESILEDRLAEFEAVDTKNFLDMSVSEKNLRLQKELATGRNLEGTAEMVSNMKIPVISVKLEDGRSVIAFLDPSLSRNEMSKISDAIIDNKKLSLRLVKQSEWNPELAITDELGVPYGDKIDVILDGKAIGSVQVTDFREAKAKKEEAENKKAQQGKQFANKLVQAKKPPLKDDEKKRIVSEGGIPAQEDINEFGTFIREFLDSNNITIDSEYSYRRLSELIGIPDSDVIRQLLFPISEYISKTGAKITFVNEIDKGAAEYSDDTNTIRIAIQNMAVAYAKLKSGSRNGLAWFNPQYWLSEVFVHELVHSVTSQKIDIAEGRFPYLNRFITEEERNIVRDLTRILDYIKLNYPEDRQTYGLKNVNELIAEAFSNSEFAAYLASIPIDASVYEAPNVFAALIRKILELLGIRQVKNSALESVVNLTIDLASNYDRKISREISDEIILHDVLFGGKGPGEHKMDVEGFVNNLTSEEKEQIKNGLFDALNAITDIQGIEVSEIVPMLIDAVEGTEAMSSEEKEVWKAMIKMNHAKIISHVIDKHFKKKGLSKKESKLTVDDLTFPEHGVAFGSEQKLVESMLKGYASLWREIAELTNTSKNVVEKTFYRIAKTGRFRGEVHNESQYAEYLKDLRGRDVITDKIVDLLSKSSLRFGISLFEFYNSLRLVKSYGFIAKGNSASMKLLNPPDKYEENVASFWNKISNYEYLGYRGFPAIEKRLRNHIDARNKLFLSSSSSYTEFESLPSEERTKRRIQQHENDLEFLSEVTGIKKEDWRSYFSQQTKETFANMSRGSDVLTDYGTYENLLANDTYRGKYTRIQSTLMYNLLYKTIRDPQTNELRTPDEMKEFFINFFTEGNEERGVMSNLFKLSTASELSEDIALNGENVLGDNFSSFVQDNMVFGLAENILDSHVKNNLTRHYFNKGREAEIIMLDGVASIDNDKKVSAVDMSYEDLWMMQLHQFMQEGNSYNAWMGQFGDKPALYFIDAPKYTAPKKDTPEYLALIEKFPGFEDAVEWIQRQFINYNAGFFNSFLPSPSPIPSSITGDARREEVKKQIQFTKDAKHNAAANFVYSFAMNMNDIIEIFHGDIRAYDNDLVSIVKRAGSSNSTGYRTLATVQGGLAETYTFALVDDKIGWERFDGIEFMSGEYAKRMQVSMGRMFSKEDIPEMAVLSSVKGLHTNINPENNLRGLTKGNIVNIELLATAFPGSKYDQLNKFMKANKIDRLSFGSTTKLYEKARGKAEKKKAMISLWDNEGKLLSKPVIPENGVIVRNTADTYIQQDLRHSAIPKSASMSSQMLSNMLILPHGKIIAEQLKDLQLLTINELISSVGGKTIDAAKLDWLNENLNENTHQELMSMLEIGMTPYDPGFGNYIRKIIASHITRKGLEIPINRVTTQEIPDADGLLQGRRFTSDKKHILLPDIAANIEGARYENNEFEGKVNEAIAYIESNRQEHADLLDENGNVIRWEIEERNGIIPGEIIMSTRVPADYLRSHTVARLKYKIEGGNFTMLDHESQKRSGSDFDGDQRFNWTLYHNKHGIVTSNSKEGKTNDILMLIARDYSNPAVNDMAIEPVNPNAYDKDIVEKYRKERKYHHLDPISWNNTREENMVGVRMKGILTDINTTYSLVNDKNIRFKKTITLPLTDKREIIISRIRHDRNGLMKSTIANLLNMAFDNAKDPKIEFMGLNEITAQMYMVTLFGDERIDLNSLDAIKKHLDNVSSYFTSPLVRDFVSYMRRNNGGMRKSSVKEISENLKNYYPENEVKRLVSFYYNAMEFSEIRRFYSMTQEVPTSVIELQQDAQIYRKFKTNSFDFIDARNLFGADGFPVVEFASSRNSLDISEDFIYGDTFEYSRTGREIYQAIYTQMRKEEGKDRKYIKEDELRAISYGLNTAAVLRAIGIKQTFYAVENTLVENMQAYRTRFPDNKFLQAITVVKEKGKRHIKISSDDQRRKMTDKRLAEIREGFDAIYSVDPNLADQFIFYAISRWGTATSTWRGSYFNLASDNYRVMLSKKMQNELYAWDVEGLSSEDKYQIMQTVLKSSRNDLMRSMSDVKPKYPSVFNYNAMASIDFSISYDALAGIEGISTNEELIEFAKEHNFSIESLRQYRDETAGGMKIKPWARAEIEKFKKRADQFFPDRPKAEGDVRNMLPNDNASEALMSEDPELQAFVYEHLRKAYPGVKFFSDREAFVDFVSKFGIAGMNVNPEAIGHAFGDAVYIDPNNAVQSTMFHEYSHIYWAALPDNNPVKMALIELYHTEYPDAAIDDIEEAIVTDIGRAGVNVASIDFRGTVLERFLELLKRFWNTVKVMFGSKKKYDLVDNLAYAVWKNSGKIKVSTNHAAATVKNMVSYNNKKLGVRFNSDEHVHFVGDKPLASVTGAIKALHAVKFEAGVASKKAIEDYKAKYELFTRENLSTKRMDELTEKVISLYDDFAEKGTVIHAVAESVFGNRVITPEEKAQFANVNDYYDLINEFEDLKNNILAAYPDAIFITEKHVISTKYEIGGFIDLVVDIGDNKLKLYDFKTVKEELADHEMKPLESYKKAFGPLKAPFSNIAHSKYTTHMMQLNMYANMMEEQEDPNQPGKKNQVVTDGLYIIPIIRELENGKIKSAKMANHHVKIPRTSNTAQLADRIMMISHNSRENFNTLYPEVREMLRKSGIAKQMQLDSIVAYSFFKEMVGDLKSITRDDVESLRLGEFSMLKTWLFDNGFMTSDLYGTKAMPFEYLFYSFVFNLTRTELINNLDTYFPEQEVNKRFKFVYNVDAPPRKWHKFTHEGEEYILHEEGYETLKENDEIMMIYDIKNPLGENERDVFFYTVLSINKKAKSILVRNQETKRESYLRLPSGTSGALRIADAIPEGIADPGSNSYAPRYNFKKESDVERHVNFSKLIQDKTTDTLSEISAKLRMRSIRKMQHVMKNFDTLAKAEEFMNDKEEVSNLLIELASLDNKITGHLVNFLHEVSMNHLLASSIRAEHELDVPTQPFPLTLNAYYMITMHPDTVFKDWDSFEGIRLGVPQRVLENHYVGASIFTVGTVDAAQNYTEAGYEMHRKLKKFAGEIDYEKALVRTSGGEVFWRTPGEKALEDEPLIREFLELLYEYHNKYDPYQAANVKNNVITRLPIVNIYMTRPEMIKRFGNKWGPVLYERLKPQKYDNVKLDILKVENGKYVKDPNGGVMTLRDIKESFAAINFEDRNIARQLLGRRWRHFMKIPGTIAVPGKAGLLNEYIKRAERIYRKGSDINNLGEVIKMNQKTIPIIGHGRTAYATEHLVEAEAKAIDSMMYRYYMKDMIGPLEYLVNKYTTTGDGVGKHVTKYIQQWGEKNLYGINPEGSMLNGKTISDLIDFGNRVNSMNKIMFSLKTQGVNLAIGQALNVIREPGAYKQGMIRVMQNPAKAIAMAKRFGLANIVDDVLFDQLEKEMRVLGVDIKKIEDVGYSFMEYAEKLNQFPIFIGLMTDAEWNAYDSKAELIDKANMLTNWRRRMILWRVQDIHGDYSQISAAPWWFHNTGKAFMPFKKWLPAYIWSHVAPYHIDKNLMVRSGILPTLKLLFKVAVYNSGPVAKRQAALEDVLRKEAEGDAVLGPKYFGNAQEYFETLIKEMEGGRVSFKELSENDKKNFRAALLFAMFQLLFTLAIITMTKGSDDPDEYRKFSVRNILPLMKRFNGDVFWIYSVENWQYFVENLIPAMSLLVDGGTFMIDLVNWNTYKKDTLSANVGFPKFILDATYFIPAGSFIRWVNQKARIRAMKLDMVDLGKYGIDSETLELLGLESRFVSKFDIKEAAFKYGKIYQMLRRAYEYDALMKKGTPPDEYYDLYFGEKLLKQERNQLTDALNGMRLDQMFEEGEFGDINEIARKSRAMLELQNQREKRTKAKTRREYNEALEKNK